MASAREEIAQRIAKHLCIPAPGIYPPCARHVAEAASLADAALSVARTHRDALADALGAEADEVVSRTWPGISRGARAAQAATAGRLRDAARRVRALFADPDSEASHGQR